MQPDMNEEQPQRSTPAARDVQRQVVGQLRPADVDVAREHWLPRRSPVKGQGRGLLRGSSRAPVWGRR